MGEWVLRTACAQAAAWRSRAEAVPVAVNVSALQFRQQEFCRLMRRVLAESGLATQYLELELTESLLLSSADVIHPVPAGIERHGRGAGHRRFRHGILEPGYLKRFRVGKAENRPLFIRDLAVDGDDATLTKAIIGMAKSLHLRVVAEGVETEAQFGCCGNRAATRSRGITSAGRWGRRKWRGCSRTTG